MRVAFFFNSAGLGRPWSVDTKRQALSGTDGTLLNVYNELSKVYEGCYILATNAPENFNRGYNLTEDILTAYQFCQNNDIDYFIFIATEDESQLRLLTTTKKSSTKLIAWAQCTPTSKWMSLASACPSFFKLIAVSNIQKYIFAHHPIYKKTVTIFNFISEEIQNIQVYPKAPEKKIVTYIGALRPSKGFHHIADIWSSFHEQNPEVELVVCGSAGLYGTADRLGPEGLAEVNYEEQILKPLGGSIKSARVLGVTFLGSLPKEKLYEFIKESCVIVVNPNTSLDFVTETFCVSAAEAMAFKTPVLGGYADGLLEIVGHQLSGLLAKNNDELLRYLTLLVSDSNMRTKYGQAGYQRVNQYFIKSRSIDRWVSLLDGSKLLSDDETGTQLKSTKFYLRTLVRTMIPSKLIDWLISTKKRLS